MADVGRGLEVFQRGDRAGFTVEPRIDVKFYAIAGTTGPWIPSGRLRDRCNSFRPTHPEARQSKRQADHLRCVVGKIPHEAMITPEVGDQHRPVQRAQRIHPIQKSPWITSPTCNWRRVISSRVTGVSPARAFSWMNCSGALEHVEHGVVSGRKLPRSTSTGFCKAFRWG